MNVSFSLARTIASQALLLKSFHKFHPKARTAKELDRHTKELPPIATKVAAPTSFLKRVSFKNITKIIKNPLPFLVKCGLQKVLYKEPSLILG